MIRFRYDLSKEHKKNNGDIEQMCGCYFLNRDGSCIFYGYERFLFIFVYYQPKSYTFFSDESSQEVDSFFSDS